MCISTNHTTFTAICKLTRGYFTGYHYKAVKGPTEELRKGDRIFINALISIQSKFTHNSQFMIRKGKFIKQILLLASDNHQ